jgi:hypothetical protein
LFFILKPQGRMNYAQYMRKVQAGQSRIVGYQNGQDASMVTMKAQARSATVKTPVSVATNFSKVGGSVGNTMEPHQQTASASLGESARGANGVVGVSGVGPTTVANNGAASVIAAAQNATVYSETTAPYQIVIPCGVWIAPPQNAPGVTKCCQKDMSQLYRNNSELVVNQGKQLTLRTAYGLPNKLQGLRGAVMNQQ